MATKSLGTLTLDLVAKTAGFVQGMSKAERESKKWKKEVKKDLGEVGKAFKIASAAAVAGLGLITVQTIRAAEEVQRFASLAGTSNREFQRYAAGAQAIGIEQEKLADIFKDTSDKVGDFLQTGAGPLADFFENIAPQVGVTAEQFRNLSGPQSLELYVSSLKKANVSQNEMTFFLEAIASDATVLLPLLKDNAKGFKDFGDAAEDAGAILNDKTIEAANELNATFFIARQATKGFKNDLVGELLPTLSDLSVLYLELSETGNLAAEAGEFLSDALKLASKTAVGSVAAFNLAGKSLGAFLAVFRIFAIREGGGFAERFDKVATILEAFREDAGNTADAYANLINKINNAGKDVDPLDESLSKTNKKVKELAELLSQAREKAKVQDIIQRNNEKLKEFLDGLDKQVILLGKTKEEQELYNLSLLGASEAELKLAKARLESISAFEKQQELIKAAKEEQDRINTEASSIRDLLLSEEDSIQQSYERRRQIVLDNTKILGEAQTQLLEDLENDRTARLDAIEKARTAAQISNAQELFGGLSELAKQFAGESSKTYKALFAAEKAVAIARSIIAIQTGISQAAASGATIGEKIAGIATVVAATSGIISTIKGTEIEGMAHDGIDEIPKTGTYLLQKGERVTTEKTSAKLDRTLDQVKQGGGSSGMMQPKIVVNNYGDQKVQTITRDDVIEILVGEAGNQRSRMRKVMHSTSNLQPRGV